MKTPDNATQPEPGAKHVGYIDLTPKWRGLMPLLIERGAAGDRNAITELNRLADIVDEMIAQQKSAKQRREGTATQAPSISKSATAAREAIQQEPTWRDAAVERHIQAAIDQETLRIEAQVTQLMEVIAAKNAEIGELHRVCGGLRDAVMEASKERGRRSDGTYLPTFGPEGRLNTNELCLVEEARLLIEGGKSEQSAANSTPLPETHANRGGKTGKR